MVYIVNIYHISREVRGVECTSTPKARASLSNKLSYKYGASSA